MEYAPDNRKYREFLALFLADAGRPGEGKEVLRSAQKNHPMIPLLEDLESVSVPEDGEFFVGHAISMSLMIAMGNAGIADHLHLRLRTYLYTKNVSEIEAFYASGFPGFHFIPANERRRQLNQEDGEERAYPQFLHVKSGRMKASRQRSEVPDPAVARDGILMIVIEKNDDPSGRENCRLAGAGAISFWPITVNRIRRGWDYLRKRSRVCKLRPEEMHVWRRSFSDRFQRVVCFGQATSRCLYAG